VDRPAAVKQHVTIETVAEQGIQANREPDDTLNRHAQMRRCPTKEDSQHTLGAERNRDLANRGSGTLHLDRPHDADAGGYGRGRGDRWTGRHGSVMGLRSSTGIGVEEADLRAGGMSSSTVAFGGEHSAIRAITGSSSSRLP